MESYLYVQYVADLHGIIVDLPRPCRRKQTSQRLRDGIVLESTRVRDVSPSLSILKQLFTFQYWMQCYLNLSRGLQTKTSCI